MVEVLKIYAFILYMNISESITQELSNCILSCFQGQEETQTMWPGQKLVKLLANLKGLMGTTRQQIEIADIIRENHAITGKDG